MRLLLLGSTPLTPASPFVRVSHILGIGKEPTKQAGVSPCADCSDAKL